MQETETLASQNRTRHVLPVWYATDVSRPEVPEGLGSDAG